MIGLFFNLHFLDKRPTCTFWTIAPTCTFWTNAQLALFGQKTQHGTARTTATAEQLNWFNQN
jgi:hypothetical protein